MMGAFITSMIVSLPPAKKITGIYILFGVLWILLSDQAFLLVMEEDQIRMLSYFQTFKGIFYVLTTGLLFFFLIKRFYKKIDEKIQELERVNTQLTEKTIQLENSNRELAHFAGAVANDMQEPLRMISSFLQRLDEKYANDLDEKAQRYVKFAISGARKMRQIILDLLDFSSITQANHEGVKIDMNRFLDDILILFRRKIEEVNATIHYENLPEIQFPHPPLRQLFSNLIDNSLTYSREGVPPVVKIVAEQKTDYINFKVTDNGMGIPKERIDQVFLPFQRVHQKRGSINSGMGLVLVKKVVESAGGEVKIDSEPGQGTTISFTLPKSYNG